MELCVFLGRIGNFLLCTNHSHQWGFSNPGMVWSSLTFSAISVYVCLHILSVVVVYRNDLCFVHDLQLPRQNWYWPKWEFYLWMSLTACRGQYSIGFSSNSHIKPAGNFYCKNHLPPFSIHLLQHIVGVRICLTLVCILHTLFGCKLFNPVNYHPTSHMKANSNLEDYLENQYVHWCSQWHVIDAIHAISISGACQWSISSSWPSIEGIGGDTAHTTSNWQGERSSLYHNLLNRCSLFMFHSFSWQLLNYSAWEKLYFLSSLLQLHSKVIALTAEVWRMEGLVGAVHTWDFQ
jgi:hypothetical protein